MLGQDTKTSPVTIAKETVNELKFSPFEVLATEDEIFARKKLLEVATTLGNVYRRKVKIIFETDAGLRRVETTVWAATENNIVLKGGRTIPIRCIRQVRIF